MADTERYIITLSEYRLKDLELPKVTDDAVAAAIETQNAEPNETLMLSAIAGAESMIQFGRTITITTGRVMHRDVTTRQTKQMEIGTLLRLTVSPEEQRVAVVLSYESSRQAGEGTDDSPPDIATISLNTVQLLELGKPTLIGATSAGEASFFLLTVSRR